MTRRPSRVTGVQTHNQSAELPVGIGLSDLKFSPKIDFVTLDGVARPAPSGLQGKCIWPRSYKGRRLTIHDPTPKDLAALQAAYPNASVAAVEVAVDVSPRAKMGEEERAAFLAFVKSEFCAKRLHPAFHQSLSSGFRGTYDPRPYGYALRPFNRRVPGPGEQHLHGTKYDALQFKVYFKIRDNSKALDWEMHVIRMEVKMQGAALLHHRLEHVGDLLGFAFRSELTPYFRHVRGTVRASARKRKPISPVLRVLTEKMQRYDDDHWDQNGIGAFLRGGKRETVGVRFLRDQALNDRIGQALHRLQRQFSNVKFVCEAAAANDESPVSMRSAA
ncbi:MAG: hypothetical protein ACD_23C01148G0001 [uncultured bacterium]|nr:MAG: hypothetical protein ACD_23C01148G0001 [uncultured bacterium]